MRFVGKLLLAAAIVVPLRSEATKQVWSISAHTGSIEALDLSPDGKWVVTAGDEGNVKVWNAKTGQQVATLAYHFDGAESVRFSADGRFVLSGGIGRQIHLHRTSDWQRLYSLDTTGFVEDLAFTADGSYFYAGLGYSSNDMRGYRTSDGMAWSITHLHWGTVWSVATSPDGRYLASSSADGRVIVFGGQYFTYLYDIFGHQDDVIKIRFSPSGNLLASLGEYDRKLILSSMPDGNLFRTITLGDLLAYGLSFSADGTKVAVSGQVIPESGRLMIYDVQTGRAVLRLAQQRSIRAVAFSPTGNELCYGSDDGRLSCISPG
jgi:WD40 repeat protein